MKNAKRDENTRLTPDFFARPTLDVAQDLLGCCLVRRLPGGIVSGRIVETEAYLGHPDQASHASRKNPKRARVMFGPPGHAYVYRVYYHYFCLNLVTEPDGVAGAVLLRAVAPLEGIDLMRENRQRPMPDTNLTSGPSKLCQAFAIDTSLNAMELGGDDLRVEHCGMPPTRVCAGPRVGIDYAGEWALKPWRFWEDDCEFVSKRPCRRQGKKTD